MYRFTGQKLGWLPSAGNAGPHAVTGFRLRRETLTQPQAATRQSSRLAGCECPHQRLLVPTIAPSCSPLLRGSTFSSGKTYASGNAETSWLPKAQSCIKLGLACASAGAREVFPCLSAGQSNPEGWQMVAGGRLGTAGETTTGHGGQKGLHPGGMPESCVCE